MRTAKKSTWLPLILLVYLLVMAFVGRDQLLSGQYLRYFSVLGISLIVIILLHFVLKKKEKMKKQFEEEESIETRSRKKGE